MVAVVNARTQAYLILLFGGALVRLAAGDALLRYVRPVARPWVLLAGIGMIVLAVALLGDAQRYRGSAVDLPRGSSFSVPTGWLLLAPVIAIVVVAPPALGSFSANRESSPVAASAAVHKDFAGLTGPAPHRLGLFDFTTRVLWDSARTVTGTDVTLTGFVLSQRTDGFVLARLVVTCCAADARPVEVFVRSPTHPAEDSWVAVTGRYAGTDKAQPTFPVLAASIVLPVKQPVNPYD
jgi:uncharacterized repeat protein (TIGR03943 family)